MKTNTLRNLMFFGVAALPVVAMAGSPVPFGSTYTFDSSSGTSQVVDYDDTLLPAGWVAGANPILDDGFAQVTLTAPDGSTYFQTIIGGGLVQGNDSRGTANAEFFSTESFVKVGASGGQGIAVDQVVDDLRGGNFGTLVSDSVIFTGADFLDPTTEATVDLTQSITDSTSGNPTDAAFVADFEYKAYLHDLDGDVDLNGDPVLNDIVGDLKLRQTIDSQDGGGVPMDRSFTDDFQFASISRQDDGEAVATVQSSSLSIQTMVNLGIALDDQDFQYEKRVGEDVSGFGAGTENYTGGLLSYIGGPAINGVDEAGRGWFANGSNADDESVDWVVGDTVDRVYISQSVDNAGDFGFASLADRANLGGGDNSVFDTTDEYQSIFSLTNAGHPGATYDPATSNPFD